MYLANEVQLDAFLFMSELRQIPTNFNKFW